MCPTNRTTTSSTHQVLIDTEHVWPILARKMHRKYTYVSRGVGTPPPPGLGVPPDCLTLRFRFFYPPPSGLLNFHKKGGFVIFSQCFRKLLNVYFHLFLLFIPIKLEMSLKMLVNLNKVARRRPKSCKILAKNCQNGPSQATFFWKWQQKTLKNCLKIFLGGTPPPPVYRYPRMAYPPPSLWQVFYPLPPGIDSLKSSSPWILGVSPVTGTW